MMRSAIILALGLFFVGCATIQPKASVSPTFASIQANILSVSCVHCHGPMGGFKFTSYTNAMKAVVPGDPQSSPLYTALKSGKMPKFGTHPSIDQIQAVGDWILAGALDN